MAKKSHRRSKNPLKRLVAPAELSLGKWLRQRRLRRGINLPKVASETHIQLTTLRAIEADQYRGLPHDVHTLGFVRRYAKFLGLEMNEAALKYKEQRGPMAKASSQVRKQRVRGPVATTRLLLIGVISVGLVIVAVYLIWQLKVLTTAPTLSVEEPANNQVVAGTSVTVSGQTTPGAEVTVNGQPQLLDQKGRFSSTINLPSGINVLNIKALNKRGKSTIIERSVLIQLPNR